MRRLAPVNVPLVVKLPKFAFVAVRLVAKKLVVVA
jgi:hypothetical protein